MEVNIDTQSVLKLEKLYFEKIEFERDENLPKTFKANFIPEYRDIDEKKTEVKLTCKITSDVKFNLLVKLIAVFENEETDKEIKDSINKINTISIMFPYIRAEISLITAQPNFPTIDLPVMNIAALVEQSVAIEGKK